MKTLLTIPFYLFFCFTSCGQKDCKITDYHSVNWQVIDSTTSFYICSNSTIKLIANDFIEIEYLGTLQNKENIVIQREADNPIFSLFTNTKFGKFKMSDTTLPKDIRFVITQLTQKSVATIKFNLGNIKPIEPDRKITVYFKNNIDSIKATKWINEIKAKPFVDSTYYLSKEAALRNWSKDVDSTWQSFLQDNPLPTSVDIFIKKNFFDTIFIRNLKSEFMKSNVVSDATYSSITTTESLKGLNQMLTNTYLIRVKARE